VAHCHARPHPEKETVTNRPAPEPTVQQRTLALLARLAPLDGYNPTPLPDVRLLRANRPLARAPVLYEPGIVIVCQGRKRGFFGGEVYLYDARHYLAVAVPVPFTMETDASEKEPLLAIYLRLDFGVAAELMLRLDAFDDGGADAVRARPKAMTSTPMDARLALSVLRLLEALASPLEAGVLGPALVREIYFRVLGGEQQLVHQVGRRVRLVLAHQAGAVDLHRAVADLQRLADLLGRQAFQQARGHLALARRQFGLHRPLRAQVLERPDARFVRRLAVERAAGDVAPEHLAAGALHDAVVGVVALGVEDRRHARAQPLVFVGAGVQHHERLPDQHLAREAEHLAQLRLQSTIERLRDTHSPTGASSKASGNRRPSGCFLGKTT
jgi:hypothetical protein